MTYVGAMIDEDGVLIKPPPAVQLPPPPPPPQPPAVAAVDEVLVPPGVNILTRPGITYILAPPAVQQAAPPPPPPATGSDDDEAAAAAIANANTATLDGAPEWELVDPFALTLEAAVNPPLKGGSALQSIAQACADYGIDPRACVANALHEGANGEMGDDGHAYGPFQDHLTDFAGRPFYGKGANSDVVNGWAWTDNGIRYSVRQMVAGKPSARGLSGHAAVYAIVYGYERPQDKPGAYKTRAGEYDHLVALGSGWVNYAAGLLHGPIAGKAVDTGLGKGGAVKPAVPTGVIASWGDLLHLIGHTLPNLGIHARNVGGRLPGGVG